MDSRGTNLGWSRAVQHAQDYAQCEHGPLGVVRSTACSTVPPTHLSPLIATSSSPSGAWDSAGSPEDRAEDA